MCNSELLQAFAWLTLLNPKWILQHYSDWNSQECMHKNKMVNDWMQKKSSDDQATSVWNVSNMVKKKICWACKTPKLSGLTNKLWPWLGNRN